MTMNVFTNFSLATGKHLVCKYPKHGRLNVLKFHKGTVEHLGFGPHGPYAKIRNEDNTIRTLRCDRMVDPVCS